MRSARFARGLLALVACLAALASVGEARAVTPVLHERVTPNADDDRRLGASGPDALPNGGNRAGGASAPGARGTAKAEEGKAAAESNEPRDPLLDAAPDATFAPDRDTRRPDVLPYEDPFVPSTSPFKRLLAFDTVDANYTLSVQDGRLRSVPLAGAAAEGGSDALFHVSLTVSLSKGRPARLPTAGPGARVLRARATRVGTDERVPFRVRRDGADNWFAEATSSNATANGPTPTKLEVDMAVPRASFGWGSEDPGWSDLPAAARLPGNAVRAARTVAAHIGASQALTPRENVKKLVDYFRSFEDADDPPPASSDIYLDLALSRKGVCRHRAFAFLVTALGLGIPTRMIANEAHAWVEVNDGALWRRIDLGGAGRALRTAPAADAAHAPRAAAREAAPPDPFGWPPHASRGDALAEEQAAAGGPGQGGRARNASDAVSRPGDVDDPRNATAVGTDDRGDHVEPDLAGRPASVVTIALALSAANAGAETRGERRGSPLRVHGTVRAGGEVCPNLLVTVVLTPLAPAASSPKGSSPPVSSPPDVALGALATGPTGEYEGELVVPARAPLGDYALFARTLGDPRCGPSPAHAPTPKAHP